MSESRVGSDSQLHQIATSVLISDKLESELDIEVCKFALLHGIETYSGNRSVRDRLQSNLDMIVVIDRELQRRVKEE